MSDVENFIYSKLGVRKEFPELNPYAAAMLLWECSRYVKGSNSVIDGVPIPSEGAAIITANHFQKYDVLKAEHTARITAGRFIRTVVKKSLVVKGAHESEEYLKQTGEKRDAEKYNPLKAFVIKGVGSIPILRDNPGRDFVRIADQILKTNQLLGVFLQSSRDEEGMLRNLEPGVAFLAIRHPDVPVYSFAFSEKRATLLEPVTYNQLRTQLGRDISRTEFTIVMADRLAAFLPEEVQRDWWIYTRSSEIALLNSPKRI